VTKPHIHLAQFLCHGPTYHSLHQPPAPVLHGFAFRPAGAQPGAEPYDLAEGVNVPVLVLHGTEDERAPIADMPRMEARMRELGKACTFRFYDGARHGFAVRTHPGYAEDAARQSFDEARRFLATHLPVTGQPRATHVRGDGNAWRPTDGSRSG
jgi:dienelactone hydrolase